MKRALLILVPAALVALAEPADAQSLFGSRGLGAPLAPTDARARVLGGIGIGIMGLNPSLVNPADVAGMRQRGVTASLQPTTRRFVLDGQSDRIDATRFPLIRFLYPIGERTVISAGYGGFLDQNWGVVTDGFTMVGPDSVPTRDVVQSTGGLAQAHFGAAYELAPTFAIGAAAGFYTGDQQRRITRSFPDAAIELDPFELFDERSYRAPHASAGFRWDPSPLIRLGGSVTWAGSLEARNRETDEVERFRLPWQLAGGASGRLSPTLLAVAGGRWAGWGDANPELGEGAENSWELGGGLEFGGARTAERTFPFRVGFNYGTLPFHVAGGRPTEWAAGLGVGTQFAMTELGPLALADFALERGRRNNGGGSSSHLTEDFWRFTFSLTVLGR